MTEVCSHRFCSLASQAAGEDPVGTAGSYDRIVMIECRMPWPYDITSAPHFPSELAETIASVYKTQTRTAFLFFSSDETRNAAGREDGLRRVIAFTRPPGLSPGYDRDEFRVPDERLPALVRALVAPAERSSLASFSPFREATAATVRDLFVCTHGAVDAACAKFGYPVYWSLVNEHMPRLDGQLRAWRVSHFGGHRFAGTLVDMPTGHSWAHITPSALSAIVTRTGPTKPLERHYRGWGGARHPFVQAAEREIWTRVGWEWMTYSKCGELLGEEEDGSRGRVRITYRNADGRSAGAYEATVAVAGYVRVPLKTAAGPRKEVPQYAVQSLTHC